MADAMADALGRMRRPDILAFVLIAVVIGLVSCTELRDIKLVEFFVRQRAQERTIWTACLFVLSSTRQFAVLPSLTAIIPWLIFFRGSDALSMSFNAVAVV